jgi:hypothetical protein
MPISFTIFLATLSSIFRSRAALQLENLALRHQIGVLQRSTKRRPRLTPVDRLVWVWLARVWSGWRSTLAIVKPETVLAWTVSPSSTTVERTLPRPQSSSSLSVPFLVWLFLL